MKAIFGFIVICILFSSGCGLNDKPPANIEKIGIYDVDNNGTFEFYYILCDSSGEMTTADGIVKFLISEQEPVLVMYPDGSDTMEMRTRKLYWVVLEYKKTDFYKAKIKGHKSVVGNLAAATRIYKPSGDKAKITLRFITTDSTVLFKMDTLIVENNSFYIKGDE